MKSTNAARATRRRKSERGSTESACEHERALQTRFCLGFGCASNKNNNNSHACFYFGELYNTVGHCQTACRQKSSLPNLLLLLLCALAPLSLSLSDMHCVKLAPLIVVAAVYFNALFRTPFPLSPPTSSLCFCRCNLNDAFN